MDSPEIPDMLLDATVDVMTAFWSEWAPADYDGVYGEALLLLKCIRAAGLELRPVDPVLAAQETTGNWELDG